MKLGTPKELTRRIIESLRLLAADYETQIRAFPDFTFAPEEISDTFTMAFAFFPQLRDAGILSEAHVVALEDIDALFERAVNQPGNDLWTMEALMTDTRWEQLRTKAAKALKLFGWSIQPPDLYWITYQ